MSFQSKHTHRTSIRIKKKSIIAWFWISHKQDYRVYAFSGWLLSFVVTFIKYLCPAMCSCNFYYCVIFHFMNIPYCYIFTADGHLRVLWILLLWPSLLVSFSARIYSLLADLYLGVDSLVIGLRYVYLEQTPSVLVFWGCRNVTPQEFIFSQFWYLKSSRSKCWLIWLLVRLFLGCRWLPSLCVLTQQGEREWASSLVSLLEGTLIPLDQVSSLMTILSLSIL